MCELDCMAKHLFTSCRCLGYEYQNYVKGDFIIIIIIKIFLKQEETSVTSKI